MPEKKISKTDTKTKSNEASSDTKTPKADTNTKSNKASSDKNSSKTDTNSNSNEPSDNTRSNYVRGESQKPVTKAYRDNWKAIFGKKR